jgi:hypothetical protein
MEPAVRYLEDGGKRFRRKLGNNLPNHEDYDRLGLIRLIGVID